ncbi:uncharacterized protein [Leptinotarsa decemlineata]|uniref:uncharacterized protein n=1 Tax=Leptinotarsa decemlineata TaxID=7539 RepID=UPI000C255B76|nr:uncharacterized protein LOC111515682 [Leptinotarsa decemlineata]
MFTLCMSRSNPHLADAQQNRVAIKQVKGGYLLRYRRGFFCPKWSEEWVVLYEDSTLAWYSDKGLSRPKGYIRISEAPELLAVGEWTRQVPRRPRFPRACRIGQLLAIGSRALRDVHWLMAQSPAEINDWMTAISNTLPPPPHLPLDDKRLSLTPQQQQDIVSNKRQQLSNGCAVAVRNGCCHQERSSTTTTETSPPKQHSSYGADHTVLSGVCIDWGHGWGWGQNSWAAHVGTLCAHESASIVPVASSVYCHSAEDYTVGGMDEVDWSAFGDFSF